MSTPFINRKHVRQYALEWAKLNRAHKFERVSESFLVMVNIKVREIVADRVKRAPSKGVTLM
jgi:hypothetical protein